MRLIAIDGGVTTYYAVIDDGKMIAQGCQALCEAVINGTVQDYITTCEADRSASGIGAPRTAKSKETATKTPAPIRKAEQLSLI